MYDEFALILAARRRQAEHDAELARFLATVDTWAHGRIEALRTQHADRLTVAALLLEENQIWWERQQRLVVLHGFFDDSLISAFAWNETAQQFTGADGVTHGCASIDGLLPDVIRAILEVADDIGLETAAHKIEVGTDDGRTGTILIEAWRQDCAAGLPATSRRILWHLRPGCMVALGKELGTCSASASPTRRSGWPACPRTSAPWSTPPTWLCTTAGPRRRSRPCDRSSADGVRPRRASGGTLTNYIRL